MTLQTNDHDSPGPDAGTNLSAGGGYDAVVIGGGAAGLSAALTLARARRSVLVVDAAEPRNAPAAHVHGFLSRDGAAPSELLANGRAEVTRYGGQVVSGRVASAQPLHSRDRPDGQGGRAGGDGGGFRVVLADGTAVRTRRLLVATGLVDELPDVPGVAERWGRDVLHCPYCHGWEVRDRSVGVLATGPMAMHQAQLFRQWTADVTLFLHTAPAPNPEEQEQLTARGIRVVAGPVASLQIDDDQLSGVRLATGELVACQAVVVAPRFTARADVLTSLGLEASEQRMGDAAVGTFVPADPTGATAMPGVWVAGNVADLAAQVVGAAAAGVRAATALNADLVTEDVRDAVAARRGRLARAERGTPEGRLPDREPPSGAAELPGRVPPPAARTASP